MQYNLFGEINLIPDNDNWMPEIADAMGRLCDMARESERIFHEYFEGIL